MITYSWTAKCYITVLKETVVTVMSYFVTTITYANNETSAMILKRCCPSIWESLTEHFQTNTWKKIIHVKHSRELPIFPEVDVPPSSIKLS